MSVSVCLRLPVKLQFSGLLTDLYLGRGLTALFFCVNNRLSYLRMNGRQCNLKGIHLNVIPSLRAKIIAKCKGMREVRFAFCELKFFHRLTFRQVLYFELICNFLYIRNIK